ncbi:hypothetical protein JHJ32_21565 [Parapedobacter sp. ISTM3]|uniref:hypothetical protein n=1 Tax=Parapedobacter sp. ISTM3 TaxID=2800130 RepID=UPI0019066FA8|nr:hypothetical protein [Parapedobacter sp. ISTM3]MBK1442603.1 hypothetical protein [Parapedobacter sp. ISTM3]
MKRSNKIGLLFVFAVSLLQSYGQNRQVIIPPNPEAAALGRYGEYPVDLSSGLAKIDIPLFRITTRELDIPVSISYHASGIKVNDIASPVGMGWTLNAGGVLTRTVRGRADEGTFGWLHQSFMSTQQILASTNTSTVYNYLQPRADGNTDNESDRYHFNVAGLAGSFVYDSNKQLVQIPYSDNRITGNMTSGYTITGPDGTVYIFNVQESTAVNGGPSAVTALYLSKIISTSKSDTVEFIYETDASHYNDIYTSFIRHTNSGAPEWVPQSMFGFSTSVFFTNSTKVLRRIVFPGGEVEISLLGDRKDRRKNRIQRIALKNKAGETIKGFRFEHSYFESTPVQPPDYSNRNNNLDYRLRLDALHLETNTGASLGKYNFAYNSARLPIYYAGGTRTNAKTHFGQDYWGYYNGVTSNDNFIPTVPGLPGGANRNISVSHAQACILTGITYPTGGVTTFTYAGNHSGELRGGLRIASITENANDGTPAKTRSFAYQEGYLTDFHGFLFSQNNFSFSYYVSNLDLNYLAHVSVSDPLLPLSNNSGNSVFYRLVTENISSAGVANGKIEYEYEFQADSGYSTGVSGPPGGFLALRYPFYIAGTSWARGPLKRETVYKSVSTSFVPVRKTVHTYSRYKWNAIKTGNSVFASFRYVNGVPSPADANSARTRYQFFDIETRLGVKKLTRTMVTTYNSTTDSVVEMTDYAYDGMNLGQPHYQMSKKTTARSDGSKEIAYHTYPLDYGNTFGFIYDMKNNNIISKPIESVLYKEVGSTRTILAGNITTYKLGGRGLVDQLLELETAAPLALGTFKMSNRVLGQFPSAANGGGSYSPDARYQPRLTYNNYDSRSNLLQVTEIGGPTASYLWSYSGQYPIAEVRNAVQGDIAYAGFESDGKGNWVYAGTAVDDVTAPGGRRVYRLSAGSLQKTGLSPSRDYLLTYWVHPSAPSTLTVSGSSGAVISAATALGTYRGWTHYKRIIRTSTSVTISGAAKVDEIRLHPLGASMDTYTYDPVVGVTSHADASGSMRYYDYDGFGRLRRIRDQEDKIVEDYRYNYRGN